MNDGATLDQKAEAIRELGRFLVDITGNGRPTMARRLLSKLRLAPALPIVSRMGECLVIRNHHGAITIATGEGTMCLAIAHRSGASDHFFLNVDVVSDPLSAWDDLPDQEWVDRFARLGRLVYFGTWKYLDDTSELTAWITWDDARSNYFLTMLDAILCYSRRVTANDRFTGQMPSMSMPLIVNPPSGSAMPQAMTNMIYSLASPSLVAFTCDDETRITRTTINASVGHMTTREKLRFLAALSEKAKDPTLMDQTLKLEPTVA